jgi:neutral ceramidase
MRRALFILLVAFVSISCAGKHTSEAAYAMPPATAVTPAPLKVGTARVDITPPAGVSTFGHGPDAHVTDGYWTRIYCRVFFLESATGERVALVPCDLPAISMLLERAVAREVSDVVNPARVMISATHTHAGPGHYFESPAYGGVLSARLPGFDPNMVDFLGKRIGAGIHEAAKVLRPASAHWEHTVLWGVTRNRSLVAWKTNPGPDPDFGPVPEGLTPEERAIDPRMDVLQFEALDASGKNTWPIGWIVLFPIHPTVLPNTTTMIGADADGIVSRLLEAELRRAWARRSPSVQVGDPLVGVLNGNEGDISPIWTVGDPAETERVARKVATKAFSTYDPDRPEHSIANVTLGARWIETELPAAETRSGVPVCDKAELGNGSSHGGSDHPTSLDAVIPTGDDIDLTRTDCQAPKKRLLGFIQPILVGPAPESFPTHVAFSLVRINETWMTFVPGEMTVHAGALVDAEVAKVAGQGAQPRVVGLSNAYIQYIASAPEYQLQRYEGGSTLYGAHTAELFADRAAILASTLAGQPIATLPKGAAALDRLVDFTYELAPKRDRLPIAKGKPKVKPEARSVDAPCTMSADPLVVCVSWHDVAPEFAMSGDPSWVELVDPQDKIVRPCFMRPPLTPDPQKPVPTDCDTGAIVDDRGSDFFTRVIRDDGDALTWITTFRPAATETSSIKTSVKLRVEGRAGLPGLASVPFNVSPGALPPVCSREQRLACGGA